MLLRDQARVLRVNDANMKELTDHPCNPLILLRYAGLFAVPINVGSIGSRQRSIAVLSAKGGTG
jgi:hypothetical protein